MLAPGQEQTPARPTEGRGKVTRTTYTVNGIKYEVATRAGYILWITPHPDLDDYSALTGLVRAPEHEAPVAVPHAEGTR